MLATLALPPRPPRSLLPLRPGTRRSLRKPPVATPGNSGRARRRTRPPRPPRRQTGEAPGKFSLQFILDDGAEEYVLRPTAEDARTLMLMIDEAQSMYFDMERRVLILRDLD